MKADNEKYREQETDHGGKAIRKEIQHVSIEAARSLPGFEEKLEVSCMWPVVLFLCLILAVLFCIYSNHCITVSQYRYTGKSAKHFSGFRILQVSDLHADLPDWKYRSLLKKTFACQPDLIVVTGDCVDKIHIRGEEKVLRYLKETAKRFPLYVVSGNHEYMHPECQGFLDKIEAAGIRVLHNEYVDVEDKNIEQKRHTIRLYGVEDPYAVYQGAIPKKYKTPEQAFVNLLKQKVVLDGAGDTMSILLSHRPEYFEQYCELGVDMVFAGHAHGGQWRLPLVGGIIAPDQGLFPRYTAGMHQRGGTVMFVSRGLGNSVVPLRLFNRPELVVVEFS